MNATILMVSLCAGGLAICITVCICMILDQWNRK